MMTLGSNGANALSLATVSQRCFVGSLLGVDECFDGVLPGARGHAVVGARQIRLGDLQIQDGLALGLFLASMICRASSALVVPRLVRLPVVVSTQ